MNTLELISYEEGYRMKPYLCSEGYPTIGIGKRIGPKGADLSLYEFTVNEHVAQAWLLEEVIKIERSLVKHEWYCVLDEDRKIIITSMAYQLGMTGLLKFKNMIAALEREDWTEAGLAAVDSKWYRQTKQRAERHAKVLYCGSIKEVY